jgi:hypothetical protein
MDTKLETSTAPKSVAKEPLELLKTENDKLREALKTAQIKIIELSRLLQIEKSINNNLCIDMVEIPTTVFNKIIALKQEITLGSTDKIANISILRKDEMARLQQQIDDAIKEAAPKETKKTA